MIRVAINGFGRIGRLVFRQALESTQFEVVAINDLVPADNLAYLLKYDSTHGTFNAKIQAEGSYLVCNGKKVRVYDEKEPLNLPWKEEKIDYVIEASGHFTDLEGAKKHIVAGAKRVIITAPSKGKGIPFFVMGVNHESYDPKKDLIVSNASCTTNCIVPLVKVLLDNFGIEEGLMTTIHAVTASQPVVDGPSKKDWRGGRGAYQNIIPASTGAAKAVAEVLPQVKGKLTGMAFRVPVSDVSVVDLTVRTTKECSYEEICQAMKKASQSNLKGILDYTDEEVVSSDYVGSKYSAIFDEKAGIGLNGHFHKLVAWYDNEMGYSSRVVDLVAYMAKREIA